MFTHLMWVHQSCGFDVLFDKFLTMAFNYDETFKGINTPLMNFSTKLGVGHVGHLFVVLSGLYESFSYLYKGFFLQSIPLCHVYVYVYLLCSWIISETIIIKYVALFWAVYFLRSQISQSICSGSSTVFSAYMYSIMQKPTKLMISYTLTYVASPEFTQCTCVRQLISS